ncbi:MAG TPA: cytochrome P450 [Caulobacteraceae bacterium]|nr:cytochrome P450 [Caulobacteraceae bacterium]
MADGSLAQAFEDRNEAARAAAHATPLDQFHVADSSLFRSDTLWPWFERLRAEDPVHYTAESEFGPYWSVTKHRDIVAVDSNHAVFSSSSINGGIAINDGYGPEAQSNFIALDPPMHDEQRRVVAPIFTSASINGLEPIIRERAAKILDELPRGEEFDFVDKVAIELTSQMLATLMDYPFEERRKLTRCSDLILAQPEPGGIVDSEEQRQVELFQILTPFTALWDERRAAPPRNDILSMLAHGEATYRDDPQAYMGNIILMIVAGSDTTRHSITGGLLALNQNPDQYAKLRANPALIESLVPEVVRWQSPVAHMRRTAQEDAEIGGKRISKGDKVVMWYVSGNRDGDVIPDPDHFIIDRERPRTHVGFGFGIHRCVGNRLAEMQLRVMWEEILKGFPFIEVTGEPRRMNSNFVKGYEAMPVRIAA